MKVGRVPTITLEVDVVPHIEVTQSLVEFQLTKSSYSIATHPSLLIIPTHDKFDCF